MKHWNMKRFLSILLSICMVAGLLSGISVTAEQGDAANWHKIDASGLTPDVMDDAMSEETEEVPPYAATDSVRVLIVLKGGSVLDYGYSTNGIATNEEAMNLASSLEMQQNTLARKISAEVLGGKKLDVRWNLTLAANAMSANLPYGKIEAVQKVAGVKAVYLVPTYELDPGERDELNTISAGTMIGSYDAWQEGYTGAGRRIAVVDTGIDADHPSFNGDAFDYSLLVTATKNGKKIEDYDLLNAEKIAQVLPKLNAYQRVSTLTGKDLYRSSKIGFAFNYIDADLDVTHDNDGQGDHGTHVSGIATANRYVLKADGSYGYADNGVVGVAPDAQLVTMKVFGKSGGAYADDYIAAIEDAVLLGCDSVNLSLGSATVGFTTAGDEYFDGVMASLTRSDTVVCMSCGNSGYWAEHTVPGALYPEDANTGRVGSPGAYANSLAVASADNIGNTSEYFSVGENKYVYSDGSGKAFASGACRTKAFTTLDTSENKTGTEYEYVFIGDPSNPDDTVKYGGSAEDFVDVEGKIVFVSRGNGVAFTDKQANANAAKAAAMIVYNNTDAKEAIYALYQLSMPSIAIHKSQMEQILADSQKNEAGVYTGKLTVFGEGVYTDENATGGVITMSSFSAWGAPGNLALKPEITAPGGNIYSTMDDGTYGLMSGTSMASPSAAGMAAVVSQYIQENGLAEKQGMTVRALAQSLLMGTAAPLSDPESDVEYSPRNQGSGLGSVVSAVSTPTYITVDGNEDGKVKAELGDDPARTGVYTFSFKVNNLTNQPVSYKLDASVLAPMVAEAEDGTKYITLSDVAVGADLTFVSDVPGFDLTEDGKLDDADVMAILNHAAGVELLPDKMAKAADFDGNGAVEAVDAQILSDILAGGSYGDTTLATLKNKDSVTVPANGSVHVTATIALSKEGRAYMEETFSNGNYLEGYVYLNATADAEGKVAVSQSIPFLAFYGNWTDSSMFDTTEYAADRYNQNVRKYLGLAKENYYDVRLAGTRSSYILGVNPYAADDSYVADRSAMREGDTLTNLHYSLIRNAKAVSFEIVDAEKGTVYYSADLGQQYGAFYYTNAGVWQATAASRGIGWAGKDVEGNPLPNNTKLLLKLTAAPEYNVAEDGTVSGLGKGATWSVPVTIDNEAPAISTMFFSSDPAGNKLINIVAQDNQYISAVQIFTEDGAILGRLSPNQKTANEKLTMSVDVASIREDKVVVLLVDYAGNVSGAELELGLGGEDDGPAKDLNGFFAYSPASKSWVQFDETTASEPATIAEAEVDFSAAENVNGYVIASDMNGYLHVMPHGDFEGETICYIGVVLQDMAYNAADGKLYALAGLPDDKGETVLNCIVAIDYFTGEMTQVGVLDNIPDLPENEALQTLACSSDGVFYTVNASSKASNLYSFRLTEDGKLGEVTNLGPTGFTANYLQTMAFDHSTDTLYWLQYYQKGAFSKAVTNLVSLDLTTGAGTAVSTLPGEMTCLYIVTNASGSAGKVEEPVRVQITEDEIVLYSGNTMQLEGYVMPWNLTNRGISWSSADEKVATVDQNGVVTAVAKGETTIKAASVLDETVYTTCKVTVMENDVTVSGIVHDYDGNSYFANIDVDTAAYTRLSGKNENDYLSVVQTDDMLLAATENALYRVDAANGYKSERLCATGGFFISDMTYSSHLDLTLGLYGYNLMIVDPTADGGYSGHWNLSNLVSAFVGVAYAGYDSSYDYFYLLSSSGSLYLVGVSKTSTGYSLAVLDYIPTNSAFSVSDQSRNQSLYYDFETGWLYWARFDGAESSSIIAIDEATKQSYVRGTFSDEAWPVVGLYSAEQQTVESTDRTGDYHFNAATSFAEGTFSSTPVDALPAGSQLSR